MSASDSVARSDDRSEGMVSVDSVELGKLKFVPVDDAVGGLVADPVRQ